MAYFTNRGMYRLIESFFANQNEPSTFAVILIVAKSRLDNPDNAAVVDKGGSPNEVGIPITGHGYSSGDKIEISGSVNYDGQYVIQSTTANEIVIESAYTAETLDGNEEIFVVPSVLTNTTSDLTEVANGNGYTTGGVSVARDLSTGFKSLTEDDTNALASLKLQDVEWTGSGTGIPTSGEKPRYPAMKDDSNNIICWWDLGDETTVLNGQTLRLKEQQISAKEVA